MTVGELRSKLVGISSDTEVVIYHEVNQETSFYDIGSVSLHNGKPFRRPDGRPGFTFDGQSSDTWLLLSAEEN